MELRLLGPVEAVENGKTIALGGPKPRLVLAALVLARGRPVSAHRLIDLLWEDDPPKSALGLLHTYMSGLRRALGTETIVTEDAGYRLDSTRMRVDVYEFERKAADLEQDAEAEWRGPALAGLTGAFARSEAKLLEDARLEVAERRIVAGLDRPGEVLAELRQLVEQHPFHERLRAHLITALELTGRRRDAMTVFHETRRLLAEELGVEPGRELQDAYRSLLEEHEPEAAPDLLPADVLDFVGREEEVRRIHRARIIAISGPPGAGKTTLAIHAAHTFPMEFRGGRLYADLRGTLRPLDPFDVLGRFLRTLGVAAGDLPISLDERVECYRMLTAARAVVVVLDDAADERQVRPLLPGGAASRCLITSRAARRAGARRADRHAVAQRGGRPEVADRVGGRRRRSRCRARDPAVVRPSPAGRADHGGPARRATGPVDVRDGGEVARTAQDPRRAAGRRSGGARQRGIEL